MKVKIEVYRSKPTRKVRLGEFRWRMTCRVAGKLRVLAESGEGYQRQGKLIRALGTIVKAMHNRSFTDFTDVVLEAEVVEVALGCRRK